MVFTDQQYEVDPVSGDVTVEWAGTGPTADINVNEFTCNLPDGMSTDCELITMHLTIQEYLSYIPEEVRHTHVMQFLIRLIYPCT